MFNVNYFLADEVLKWKTDEESGRWIVSNGLLGKSYWNPMYDLSDAWTVLEVFKEALVRKRLEGMDYRAWIIHDGEEFVEHGKTPSKAICNVVLKAFGRKERV